MPSDPGRLSTAAQLAGAAPAGVAPATLVAPRRAAVAVGIAAALTSFALSWVPSLWYDEAATVVSATRSWAALWREVHHLDAVHGVYYGLMHLWFDMVGYSPETLRLPSAVAVGAASALTVLIGVRLGSLRLGVVAGVLFAVMPHTTYIGAEGRSYALSTVFAAGSSLVLLEAIARGDARDPSAQRWWIGYAALSAAGAWVFGYLLLLTAAHGVTVALRHRNAVRPWAWAAAAALVAYLPLGREAARQTRQIGWIPRLSAASWGEVFGQQWFDSDAGVALFAWLLLAVAAVICLRRWRQGRGGSIELRILALTAPALVLPTLLLIGASAIAHPLYAPRYLAMCLPAVALLAAVPLAALRWRHARAAAVVGLGLAVVLAAPRWWQQREPVAEDGSAWNEVAALVAHERHLEPAGSRDDVVYGHLLKHPAATMRIVEESYPAAFRGMDDIALVTPATRSNGLWETQTSLSKVLSKTSNARYVWLLSSTSNDLRAQTGSDLASRGFHRHREWRRTGAWIVQYER